MRTALLLFLGVWCCGCTKKDENPLITDFHQRTAERHSERVAERFDILDEKADTLIDQLKKLPREENGILEYEQIDADVLTEAGETYLGLLNQYQWILETGGAEEQHAEIRESLDQKVLEIENLLSIQESLGID